MLKMFQLLFWSSFVVEFYAIWVAFIEFELLHTEIEN
jgi:hypothetical protein